MAFRFSLQQVLRLRESLEDQERLRLAALNSQAEGARREIDMVACARLAEMERRAGQLSAGGASAAQIQFHQDCIAALDRLEKSLQQKLRSLEELCAQQRAIFQQARREREVLDQLREDQAQLYRLEENRRDQKRSDELFLMSSKHRSRG